MENKSENRWNTPSRAHILDTETMTENIELFGRLLSDSRNKLLRGVQEAAIEIGVSASTLSKWEHGDAFPTEDKIITIAKVYNVNLENLIKSLEISKEARKEEKDFLKSITQNLGKRIKILKQVFCLFLKQEEL